MTRSVPSGWNMLDRNSWQTGHSLIEVMMAMVLASLGLAAGLGMAQVAERGLQQGIKSTRALSMAESIVETKRASAWNELLRDDVDQDGVVDTVMRDDGIAPDEVANDGIYTAGTERQGIHLTWSVALTRHLPLASVTSVVITAQASYRLDSDRLKEIRLATLRANPTYVGAQ